MARRPDHSLIGSFAVRLTTLKRRAEFQRIRGGLRWSSTSFLIEAKAALPKPPPGGPGDDEPRFGFTITKKIGGAVERNRIRRRMKHALAPLVAAHARPAFDYVIVARPPALDRDFAALVAEFECAFERLHRPKPARPTSGRRPT